MVRFVPGVTVITREVWQGEVWAVRPMVCVSDTDHLALWFPRGTPWLHPVSRATGARVRVPTEAWDLREARWHLDDNLILVREGEAHAVHLFFGPDGSQRGWYVNLQEPMRRTAIGYDFMDQALDLVVPTDLTDVAWKDEDDFAVLTTLIGDAASRAIRAEGERVVARMGARAWPFDGSFATWQPNPARAAPALTDAWRAAPTV